MKSPSPHPAIYSNSLEQFHGVRKFWEQQIANSSSSLSKQQDISTPPPLTETLTPLNTCIQDIKTRQERVQTLDAWNPTVIACRERGHTMSKIEIVPHRDNVRDSPKFALGDRSFLSAKMQSVLVTLKRKIDFSSPSGSPVTIANVPSTPRVQKGANEVDNGLDSGVKHSQQTRTLFSKLDMVKTTLSGWKGGSGSKPTSPEARRIETPCPEAYNVHHPVNSIKKWSKNAANDMDSCALLAELIVIDAIAISDLEPVTALEGESCLPYLVINVDTSMRKTRKLQNTQASKFEERFVFLSSLKPGLHDKELMSVAVMNENSAEPGKHIGQVYIDLCVAQNESFAGWYTLTDADHRHCGSVYIVFRRLPITTVEALAAAKELASAERSLNSTDKDDYHSILPDVWPSYSEQPASHDEDHSASSPGGASSWPLNGLKRKLTWGRYGDIDARTENPRRNVF
ncbi:hypothetical protein ABG067_001344 [Albugo candida]